MMRMTKLLLSASLMRRKKPELKSFKSRRKSWLPLRKSKECCRSRKKSLYSRRNSNSSAWKMSFADKRRKRLR